MAVRCRIVAIAGCSCSGKTTLARHLARALDAAFVPIDAYYRDLAHLDPEERARNNFDAPEAIEHELLTRHLRQLATGQGARRPVYDFRTHTRRTETKRIRPTAWLVLDGLFALHWPEVRKLSTLGVFVTLDDDRCFERRLQRDIRYRGRTPASVIEQYRTTVRPMALRYVIPSKKFADLVVSGAEPVAETTSMVLERLKELAPQAHPAGPT